MLKVFKRANLLTKNCFKPRVFSRRKSDESKNFDWEKLDTSLLVDSKGDVRVQESYTYLFRGRFTYGMRYITIGEQGKLDNIEDVSVSEINSLGRVGYKQLESKVLQEVPPNTFKVTLNDNLLAITWYFKPTDPHEEMQKTFLLEYKVKGGLIIRNHLKKILDTNNALQESERDHICNVVQIKPYETHRLYWNAVADFPVSVGDTSISSKLLSFGQIEL